MLPIERQNKIREWIKTENTLKVSEISKRLGVSEMTIYRDVKPLVEEGLVLKTSGGITLTTTPEHIQNKNNCTYCHKPIHSGMAYRLILNNEQIETTCCPHCGLLRHKQLGDKVVQAICSDFLRHTTISALHASYVLDTSLHVECCQPQVLVFEYQEHAKKFIKGFGGSVYTFSEAMTKVDQKMNGQEGCCHSVKPMN
ncbi:DeoR family transcriptional regulator [Ferdinandcohnia quinoae]|uniref:DeoR family transcriptional regulator n=1 Tax=Fredinandcohnia quinoae TaxID=2918902 RepID=A0AAW5E5Y2_9BACI|nr:DeoR family transcriptional regulator [Fredinandcohnia sp. SECRCQ15]MCH1627908.1 DeoR family transcriptional regulator [Fredinandcohnia sp. SECRCQ15]